MNPNGLDPDPAARRTVRRGSRLYWACHLGGWALHFIVWIPFWPIESVVALSATAVVLTHQFRNVIHRRGWRRMAPRQLVPRVLGASLVTGIAMSLAAAPWLVPHVPPEFRILLAFASLSSFTGIVLGWFVIYFAYHYRERVRQAEAEKWRWEVATRDAELSALRAQLNPHFLFNSLNSLRGLIGEDPQRAQRAVTDLAALLRHTLRLSRRRTASLREELEAVRHYLRLEHLRFEERLQYDVEASPASLDARVPPMLLQTLVENSIKHGISHIPDGGMVRVHARLADGCVVIQVENSGQLRADDRPGGIGLANSLDRLRLLCGDRASLDIRDTEFGTVRVEAKIPFAAAEVGVDAPPPSLGQPTVREVSP